MHQVRLEAKKREAFGKGSVRALRRSGWIPGNLYGGGRPNVALQLSRRALWDALVHQDAEHALINLSVDEEQTLAVIKEVQRGPIRHELLHVDFQRIRPDEQITMEVPVVLTGEAVGIQRGGILEHFLRTLHVRTVPTNIPDALTVDISALDIGYALHVQEVPIPEGAEILDEPEAVVVAIAAPRVAVETAPTEGEEEEEAQPERVGERSEEEAEESS